MEDSLKVLLSRLVSETKDLPGNELASMLRVSESYVTKLRKGFRPTRMNRDTRLRVQKLLGPGRPAEPASRVREEPREPYGAGPAAYARSVLRIIERSARAIAESAAEAQEVLSTGRPAVISPTAEEVEAGAAVLEELAARELGKPTQKKRRA